MLQVIVTGNGCGVLPLLWVRIWRTYRDKVWDKELRDLLLRMIPKIL